MSTGTDAANKVPSLPHMDEEGLACFQSVIAKSECYLEYGSGGSTVHANNVAGVKAIVSVESDRRWAEAVAGALDKTGAKVLITHCDIGEVGAWGMPTNPRHMDRIWRYMAVPWDVARQHGLIPDTVLVDGRFRVASFLFSLLSARVGTTILFDDYFDRPEYFVAEEFCRLRSRHGRMGLFEAAHDYTTVDIVRRIAQYSVVPR